MISLEKVTRLFAYLARLCEKTPRLVITPLYFGLSF